MQQQKQPHISAKKLSAASKPEGKEGIGLSQSKMADPEKQGGSSVCVVAAYYFLKWGMYGYK